MEFIGELDLSHWMTLAAILLIAEVMLPSGFFLGAAAGAAFTGGLGLLIPSWDWHYALMTYAASAVVFSYIAVTRFRGLLDFQSDHGDLNDKMGSLIGRSGRVVLAGTIAKVQIADTLWSVNNAEGLKESERVVVTSVIGSQVVVQPSSAQ